MIDDWSSPVPRPVRPGEWPRFEAALAEVNRDLAATLPDQRPLVLMLSSLDDPEGPTEQLHVTLPDGQGHGNAVHPGGMEDMPEPEDTSLILWLVADAAQETVTELLWQVWPLCPEHRLGMHPRPAGTTHEWYLDGWQGGCRVVWWCRGGRGEDSHDVAEIGDLVAALPGKQRRAFRRKKKRDGH